MVSCCVAFPTELVINKPVNIKTSILIATKTKTLDDYEIFTGVIEDIGFDSKGNDTKSPDWLEVADAFKSFIDKEGW